jgi:hypothetical protein
MILKIEKSPIKYKRYRAIMDDGKKYDFGLLGGETYLDHRDANKRRAYWARHYANETEKKLIDNLVPSPALFSAYLLWGGHSDLDKNVKELNNLWKLKHRK